MNIKTYFSEIKEKINKLNAYASNPINHKNINNNPFASTLPKTYVWIDAERKTNQ